MTVLLAAAADASGATDSTFWDNRFFLNGINGTVNALAVSGTNLYAGGSFTSADGVAATNIAHWNGARWSSLGGGVNGQVNAIAVRGHEVYVGGTFTNVGPISANRVAKWDGTNWSALGSGVNGPAPSTLNCQLSALNPLLVGGTFIKAGGLPAANLARWDGSQWTPVGEGMNSPPPVAALALKPSEMYLGGSFRFAGGKPAADFTIWYSAVGLEISHAGEAVAVSWPAAADGYALQATATFSQGSWQPVTNLPVRLGSQWSVIVTNPDSAQFYRLLKQ